MKNVNLSLFLYNLAFLWIFSKNHYEISLFSYFFFPKKFGGMIALVVNWIPGKVGLGQNGQKWVSYQNIAIWIRVGQKMLNLWISNGELHHSCGVPPRGYISIFSPKDLPGTERNGLKVLKIGLWGQNFKVVQISWNWISKASWPPWLQKYLVCQVWAKIVEVYTVTVLHFCTMKNLMLC